MGMPNAAIRGRILSLQIREHGMDPEECWVNDPAVEQRPLSSADIEDLVAYIQYLEQRSKDD